MNETIKYTNLIFELNKRDKTANLIGNDYASGDVVIPLSINHEDQEFIVTNIKERSFKKSLTIRSIHFPDDSRVKTIEKETFSESTIENIFIPSSVSELKKGWCIGITQFTKITVMPNNKNYQNYNDNIIIGKSDSKSENFDSVIFVPRNIKSFTLPPFIKKIAPYAFSESSIETIVISPHLTQICERAFNFCDQLKSIEFPTNSELQIIEEDAFFRSSIESITIPTNVTDLKNGWCSATINLTKFKVMPNNKHYSNIDNDFIVGKSDLKSDIYDILIFARRDIIKARIPPYIKVIGSHAFGCCRKIQEVEICQNSELQTIENYAFIFSSIEKITIPIHVTKIGERAFNFCHKLRLVDIPTNSNLKIIENNAFDKTSIERITIPSTVVEIKKGWCSNTINLTKFKVMPNNKHYSNIDNDFIAGKSDLKSDIYDILFFARRDIIKARIPPFIKVIGSHSFEYCDKLKNVEIPIDSKLQIIEEKAFAYSKLKRINLPNCLHRIDEDAFYQCAKLMFVEIQEKSDLQIIEKNAFYNVSIRSLFIPSHLAKIGENAFYLCDSLQIIEVDKHSKFILNDINSFQDCEEVILMVPLK